MMMPKFLRKLTGRIAFLIFSTFFQRGHLTVEGRTRFCVFFSPSRNQYYIGLNITYPNLRHSIHWLIGIIRIKMTTTWRHTPLSHAPISIVPWKPPFFQHVCW